ncbi:15394_t:CDS:2, partial [Acaulospora colombiana]
MKVVNNTPTPIFYNSFDEVPKDCKGNPTLPLLNANYMPTISVEESGTTAHLNLVFKSGTAWLQIPFVSELSANDMSGWVYSIAINLNFAGISHDDLVAGKAVPKIVSKHLDHFNSSGFAVSQLFLDFNSVDLMGFDPIKTTTGNHAIGTSENQEFVYFMRAYLGYLQKNPNANPYILGYTISQTPTTVDPDANVPDSLKPIGQTFTVFKDPTTPQLSTINFILNTKGGQANHGPGSHSSPDKVLTLSGIFDTNWITPTEQCDAKMVYSTFSLIETLILKPIYKKISVASYDAMKKGRIQVNPPPDYEHAASFGLFGLSFTISNANQGDDQYVNIYTVNFVTSGSTVNVVFNGHMSARKGRSKDM